MAIFEPSDLFDFEQPLPQVEGDEDAAHKTAPENGAPAAAGAALGPPSESSRAGSPPPLQAGLEKEAAMGRANGAAGHGAHIPAPGVLHDVTNALSHGATAPAAAPTSNGFSFGESMFDDEPIAGPSASTSSAPLFEMDFDFGTPVLPPKPAPAPSSSRLSPPPACPAVGPPRSRIELTPPPQIDFSLEVVDEIGRVLPRIHAETADGGVVTFRRRLRRRTPVELTAAGAGGAPDAAEPGLLATPLHKLVQEVDELRSREAALRVEREINNDLERPKGKVAATVMWVDKYRPKKFSDLLGEDRVHREVMNWLKEWDQCVFKRIPPRKRKAGEEENRYVDPLGRPRERVLLLSGPPGYGKTTLAHVVARHAGYRTLEINASDDRSATTVTTRIKNAIDAGSGLDADGRPTCVIIDEIDGASGGGDMSFVRSLIKLIQDVPARKKNTTAQVLRRPIVCICNDLYAPALRPLRPFARIVRFKKPPSQFIVQRLREICQRERLTADLRVLTSLVDLTSGDVRSCLNTLQFIKFKSAAVTQDAIKSAAVGTKDSGTSLQTAWNSLLAPMAAKQRRKQLGIDDGRYVDRLAFMVQACGEYDRVVQGCFEHYPNLKPLDASFANICGMHDWIAYYDRLAGRVGETMEFELMAYMPYAIVAWYKHFAAPANAAKPAEWPKADYEAYQIRVTNEEIATGLLAGIPPSLRSLFSSQGALIELIPLLMRIISPPLKPVNANIVKPHERRVLARLVELMLPLNLRFWQEKGEDGQPMMRLEPAIDVFVHYDGKRAGDINASRFAVRQLVAQAMDAEVARRRGLADGEGGKTATADMLAEQYGKHAAASRAGAAGAGATSSSGGASAQIATDFFGRVVVPKSPPPAPPGSNSGTAEVSGEGSSLGAPPQAKRFKAKYRFNEGSSAAVRKPVKMSALM